MLDRTFLALLLFVPLGLAAAYFGAGPLAVFALSGLSLIPLAKFLSDATDEVAMRAGPAIGGLLNATFGNAPELIVGILALSAGLVDVVKASIIGSILGNLLFVLGLAIFLGGIPRLKQSFNATAARASATVLLLSATALVIPAIFFLADASTARTTEELSLAVGLLMLAVYGANLLFTFRTHKHLYLAEKEAGVPMHGMGTNVFIMLATTAGVAVMSELLVGAIEPVSSSLGLTALFMGAIVIAIIGNAGEHVSAVVAAMKGKIDLALQISLGSATQIVMLVMPLLVFISAFLTRRLTLVFTPFELAALVFAIFITNSVIEDGETNWFEGFMLLVVYLIVGVAFFLLPA